MEECPSNLKHAKNYIGRQTTRLFLPEGSRDSSAPAGRYHAGTVTAVRRDEDEGFLFHVM